MVSPAAEITTPGLTFQDLFMASLTDRCGDELDKIRQVGAHSTGFARTIASQDDAPWVLTAHNALAL